MPLLFLSAPGIGTRYSDSYSEHLPAVARSRKREAIITYKKIRPMIQLDNLSYRLISPYNDKGVSSLLAYKIQHYCNQIVPRFRMDRLKADKQYRITELNRKRCPSAATGQQNVLRKNTDETRCRATATT